MFSFLARVNKGTVELFNPTLYIMRHGVTDMNLLRRMQGHIDTELNEEGRQQAQSAGMRLRDAGVKFDRVYSSPLARAKESAVLVSGFAEDTIRVDDRLIEFNYGSFEGKSYEDLDGVMADFLHDPEHVAPPEGVEKLEDLNQRVASFLDELKEDLPADGNILLMVHGIVIRSMYGYFNNTTPDEMWKIMIDNCEVFRVNVSNNAYGRLLRDGEGSLL